MMTEFINGMSLVLWRQSWQLIVLAILVWPVARLSQRHYPRFAYILWLMVALKSIIPMNFRVAPLTEIVAPPGFSLFEFSQVLVGAESAFTLDFGFVIGCLWILTVCILAAKLIFVESRFHKYLTQTTGVQLPGFPALVEKFNIKREVTIVSSRHVSIPLTFGLRKPVIILPENQMKRDNQALLPIIAHELAHIQRKDAWAISLQMILNILFFFHPFMRLVNRQLDLNRERICDELAMRALELSPRSYGKELLSHIEAALLPAPELALSGAMFMTKKNILKRFEYLMDGRGYRMLKIQNGQKLVLGLLLLAMIVLSCSQDRDFDLAGTNPQLKSENGIAERVVPPPPGQEDENFVAYKTPPAPIGGFQAIQKAVIYPELARKSGIQGTAVVQAVIKDDGRVGEVTILKSAGEESGLDQSAMNAIKSILWNPARLESGEAVTVKITVPVVFKLGDK